jgi:hypothetical protein
MKAATGATASSDPGAGSARTPFHVHIGTVNIMYPESSKRPLRVGNKAVEAFLAELDHSSRCAPACALPGDSAGLLPRATIRRLMMTTSVHGEILERLGTREPEAGGALVGPRNHPIVTHFLFDEGAAVSSTTYTPDHATLNASLPRFREVNLEMKGLVHSHPAGAVLPSPRDVAYVRLAFKNPKNRVEEYLLPIVCEGRLHAYVFTREDISEQEGNDRSVRVSSLARLVLV